MKTLRRTGRALSALLVLWLAAPAGAVVLSLSPENQNVTTGQATLDLVASQLTNGVGAWDVDIGFDTSVLAVNSVVFGDGLDVGLFGSTRLSDDGLLLPGLLDVFEVSFELPGDLLAVQGSTLTLAQIVFDVALAPGASTLVVIDPASVGILGGSTVSDVDGIAESITATADALLRAPAAASLPVPGTLLLLLAGLVGLGAVRPQVRLQARGT